MKNNNLESKEEKTDEKIIEGLESIIVLLKKKCEKSDGCEEEEEDDCKDDTCDLCKDDKDCEKECEKKCDSKEDCKMECKMECKEKKCPLRDFMTEQELNDYAKKYTFVVYDQKEHNQKEFIEDECSKCPLESVSLSSVLFTFLCILVIFMFLFRIVKLFNNVF